MKLLKLLSFSWWITTAKRKLPLPWDVKLDGSSAVMRSRKIMSSSRPGQQHCHANACFCPHLENITPPVLFPLPSAQPPSPPFYCWIALLSHTHPYILISHFHTNLPDKLSPLQHSLSQTCPQPPKKAVCSLHVRAERHHPRAEMSIMPRGTSAWPPSQ